MGNEHAFEMERAALENAVEIDRNDLDTGYERQPDLVRRVNELYADAVADHDTAKDELKAAEAETTGAAPDKLTVGGVKAFVDRDPQVLAARRRIVGTARTVASLNGLKDAYSQRSYSLKGLAELWIAGYYQNSSTKSATVPRELRDRQTEDAKAQLAEMRRARQFKFSEPNAPSDPNPNKVRSRPKIED